MTGRPFLGMCIFPLHTLPPHETVNMWIPIQPYLDYYELDGKGEIRVELSYKPFEDEENEFGIVSKKYCLFLIGYI